MSNKLLFIYSLLLLSSLSLRAQRVQVLDKDGMPVPFVAATTPEGKYIASADADGWFENLSVNKTIHLSQVAYKPLTVDIADIKDGKIVLQEAEYDLPEVVVKPKELLYCQTYFREVYIDDEGPIFYRGGVIDNSYNIAKKKVDAKSRHLSKAQNAFWRAMYSSTSGRYDKYARLPEEPYYNRLCKLQQQGIIIMTDAGDGRQIIADSISQLGYIYWNKKELTRTVSFDVSTFNNHRENKKKKEEAAKKGKTFVPDTVKQQRFKVTFYQVYRTDSIGNSTTDDFLMSQYTNIGRHRHSGIEYLIQVQSFATDFAYIDKKEYKQMRNENKVEMNIQELRQFEKNNNIPPLAPNIQEQIDKLFAKELMQ
ncbi:MAG: hypothetical protein IJ626_04765 [Muribaculaceae bacterium]|nr:hypothetical protein [Muribaculaceae bacterium]